MRALWLLIALFAAGCMVENESSSEGTGGSGTTGSRSNSGSPSSHAKSSSASSRAVEPSSSASELSSSSSSGAVTSSSSLVTPADAPACGTPLVERIRITRVDVLPWSITVGDDFSWAGNRPVHVASVPGGSRVAWSSGDGLAHVTPLDALDARSGPDLTILAESIRGFVAHDDGTSALLVVRGDDVFFVKLDAMGQVLVETQLLGQLDPSVEGASWVSWWGHQGRMLWDGMQYVVYLGHSHNFASVGSHQGDLMWFLDGSGQHAGGLWDWGCSHSLDVRLALSNGGIGGLCVSDAYPGKAILFNHNTLIHDEPSGNMAGSSTARLGGLVGLAGGGFALTFASDEGRCAMLGDDGRCASSLHDVGFVRIGADGAPGAPTWLTNTLDVDEESAHLGRYGDGLLAAWKSPAGLALATLDENGSIHESSTVGGIDFSAKNDLTTHPNGDVSWAFSWDDNTSLKIVRVRACR